MPKRQPTVSVCMIAYNVENYIQAAIEGVLMQQTDFEVELVLGEDCSADGTRDICEHYQQLYPDRIIYLPNKVNMGIGKNHYRTLMSCQGKYVAVCDSDDVWTDPHKLQYQIDFLEQNPDYGLVYTDINCIDKSGNEISCASVERLRLNYAEGDVFFKLLQGNFINNCTVVFRRTFLTDYQGYINPICHDWLLWLRIAARSKVHFHNARTTQYRIHAGGVTNSVERIKKNVPLVLPQLQDALLYFHQVYQNPISNAEKLVVFRKMLSLIYRLKSPQQKLALLKVLPHYFPGVANVKKLMIQKLKKPTAKPPLLPANSEHLVPVTKDATPY